MAGRTSSGYAIEIQFQYDECTEKFDRFQAKSQKRRPKGGAGAGRGAVGRVGWDGTRPAARGPEPGGPRGPGHEERTRVAVTPKEVLALIRQREVTTVDLRFMDFPGV